MGIIGCSHISTGPSLREFGEAVPDSWVEAPDTAGLMVAAKVTDWPRVIVSGDPVNVRDEVPNPKIVGVDTATDEDEYCVPS